MKKQVEIAIPPEQASNTVFFKKLIAQLLHCDETEISGFRIVKRSLDARKQKIVYRCLFEVFINEIPEDNPFDFQFKNVAKSPVVIIAGTGPAGIFAALRCIELGLKPILLERGKMVRERKYDISSITRDRIISPDSNYCFGEGGAGTFSDGKLYTRSTKRGNVHRILQMFYMHGAQPEILFDAHPHIGTDKLPILMTAMRKTIEEFGGEIHFEERIIDFKTSDSAFKSAITAQGNEYAGQALILATGHSARDIYFLLNKKNILLEAAPFAAGFRIEHPQAMIDEIQYHQKKRGPFLPAATYSMAGQFEGRGVFSFCMCPGGTIVDASSGQDELVLNGMSNSRRNLPFANAGLVVTINADDYASFGYTGPMAGIEFQRMLEKTAFKAGGENHNAPVQRLTDFVENKISNNNYKGSYIQGTTVAPLHEIFPLFMVNALKKAVIAFDQHMKGFYSSEATFLAVESRTSSPVRIPRDPVLLSHVQVKNLFPCGEGAGYSGGIVSSAIDGERAAEAVATYLMH